MKYYPQGRIPHHLHLKVSGVWFIRFFVKRTIRYIIMKIPPLNTNKAVTQSGTKSFMIDPTIIPSANASSKVITYNPSAAFIENITTLTATLTLRFYFLRHR